MPHLEGSDHPASANHTTVTFDDQDGSVGENHSSSNGHSQAAAALDQSTDPSVTAYLNSASAFFPGSDAEPAVQAHELDRR
ncbi:hypothetical protein SAMN03159343_3038 [Klenkia marina]|uniref:Uncharacterized protein n=1 Tax=Klenkia marina TaxID=1960309 RepID=A0A1G4YN38_9ACTN|nr:hypothetical protein [Klenkia marina]SCX54228.1 hypothetical protein SAMN03159343_3038 [Klenkia marina]